MFSMKTSRLNLEVLCFCFGTEELQILIYQRFHNPKEPILRSDRKRNNANVHNNIILMY